MRLLPWLLVFFAGSLALPATSSAQSRQTVRDAVRTGAAYIGAAAVVEEARRSTCGYALALVKPSDHDSATAANEVIAALPKAERDELLAYHPLAHARETARTVFEEMKRGMAQAAERIDPKTACGLLAGAAMGMLSATRTDWERARENLSK